MEQNQNKLKKRTNTFSSFAWPDEFRYSPSDYKDQNDAVNIEKNDQDQVKLNSLCRRSFLQAETAEERKFLARICEENTEEENKGNKILYDEDTSININDQKDDNIIKRLPRLPRLTSGYGRYLDYDSHGSLPLPYRSYQASPWESNQYSHHQPHTTIIKIIRPQRSPGLFDTFLNFFSIGFEPFILLLGLAGAVAAAALFLVIRNSGRRSLGWRLLTHPEPEPEMDRIQERVLTGLQESQRRYGERSDW